MKGLPNKPENKEFAKERANILSKIGRFFHKIGRKAFGTEKIMN